MISILLFGVISSAPIEGIADAPEKRQTWGSRSTAELSAMTLGRTVLFAQTGRDASSFETFHRPAC